MASLVGGSNHYGYVLEPHKTVFCVLFWDWRPTRAHFTFDSILKEVTDDSFV